MVQMAPAIRLYPAGRIVKSSFRSRDGAHYGALLTAAKPLTFRKVRGFFLSHALCIRQTQRAFALGPLQQRYTALISLRMELYRRQRTPVLIKKFSALGHPAPRFLPSASALGEIKHHRKLHAAINEQVGQQQGQKQPKCRRRGVNPMALIHPTQADRKVDQ